MGEDLNRHYFKEDMQMTNKHIKWCSISFIIREMKMKTTIRYPFTRWVQQQQQKATRQKITSVCENVEKLELSDWKWACKSVQPLWKIVWHKKKWSTATCYINEPCKYIKSPELCTLKWLIMWYEFYLKKTPQTFPIVGFIGYS